jgi:hypothetical protein
MISIHTLINNKIEILTRTKGKHASDTLLLVLRLISTVNNFKLIPAKKLTHQSLLSLFLLP